MKMSKEEFKEMFLECFTVDLHLDYDQWLNVRLKDAETGEVLIESWVSCGEIVCNGAN